MGGKVYVVGRRDCDILVPNDATVSRKHAELTMTHVDGNLSNVTRLPVLKLKDLSKYGTWVNNQKVNCERILNDGDSLYFGSMKSTFMIVFEPLIVTSSCLDSAAKKFVCQQLCILGGHMVNEWQQNSTLLVMERISVTIKVICALVSQKSIITPNYLEAFVKYLQGTGEKPDPDMYTPVLGETQLDPSVEVTFTPNVKRKTLFRDMTFLFFSQKQFNKLHLAIELAGGKAVVIDQQGNDEILIQDGTVVMNCTDTEMMQSSYGWFKLAQQVLKRNGKHMIDDAEIGYAVLYCSTECNCNPDYTPNKSMSRIPYQSVSQMELLVTDTETQNRSQSGQRKPRSVGGLDLQMVVKESCGDISHIKTAVVSSRTDVGQPITKAEVPVIQVKKEIERQPVSQETRKRDRTENDDDDDINIPAILSKRVKTEQVTDFQSSVSVNDREPGTSRCTKNEVFEDWDDDEGIDYHSIDPNIYIDNSNRQKNTTSFQSKNQESPKIPKTTSSGNTERENPKDSTPYTLSSQKVVPVSIELNSQSLTSNIAVLGHMMPKTEFIDTDNEQSEKPIQDQVQRNKDYQVEDGLPSGCIQVEFVSLLARHPYRKEKDAGDCKQCFTKWSGKIVRNFKNFKKIYPSGTMGLPHIIGGSSLGVHVAERSKDLDNWFKESLQNESQKSAEDKRVQALFDYDPNVKKRGR